MPEIQRRVLIFAQESERRNQTLQRISQGLLPIGRQGEGFQIIAQFSMSVSFQCNLLHDHIDGDRRKYSVVRRQQAPIKKKKKLETTAPVSVVASHAMENRYFEGATPSPSVQQNIPKFSKTAPILPDFIKL
jgi:hypothetical protein